MYLTINFLLILFGAIGLVLAPSVGLVGLYLYSRPEERSRIKKGVYIAAGFSLGVFIVGVLGLQNVLMFMAW